MQRKIARTIVALLALALAATPLFASGGSEAAAAEAETIPLSIYVRYADEESQVPYDYAMEALQETYPNVEIELVQQGPDPGQELRTMAASNTLPDIYDARLDVLDVFMDSGDAMVLNDYVEEFGYEEKMLQSAMNTLYHTDGNVYAFPFVGNEFFLLYINRALFEEYGAPIPETFDEFAEAVEIFRENDIVPVSLFGGQSWLTVSTYDAFATRFEPQGILGLDRGDTQITDEAYLRAAEVMYNLIQSGFTARGATAMDYDEARSLFYEGQAAMFMNGHWEITDSTDALGDDVDWIPFPIHPDYPENRMAFPGGGGIGGFAVSGNTDYPDTAARVAALFAEKYAEARLKFRGNPIVALDVDVESDVEMAPMMEKLADMLPDVKSNTTFTWGMQNASGKVALEDATQEFLAGSMTPEEFIDGIEGEF